MTRDEHLEKFILEFANVKNYEVMLEVDEYCKKNKEKLTDKMEKSFIGLFEKIKFKQQNDFKKDIKVITLAVSRTYTYLKDYKAIISAYNDDFYLDDNVVESFLDLSEYFQFYERLENIIYIESKKYIGKINKSDIQMIMQSYFKGYVRYISNICRLLFRELIKKEEFNSFRKCDELLVYAGEHKSDLELVYTNITQDEDKMKKIENIIGNREEHFMNVSCCDSNLQDKDFCNTKVQYSFFNRSDLSTSVFYLGFFIGTYFIDCKMERTQFESTMIHDANFENADLRGTSFKNAIAGITKPQKDCIYSAGFLGVNFKNANLEYVNFEGADFSGADFRNAIFGENDFTNTNLDKATFSEGVLKDLKLSQKQLSEIIID